MAVAALLVGAGRGERFRRGQSAPELRPKAFVELAGRSLIERAASALAAVPELTAVVPVVAESALGRLSEWAPGLAALEKVLPAVAGGAERQDSVRAGLAALPPETALVAVHDAARPLVRPADVSRVVEVARGCGAAILALPVRDTLKRVREGRIIATPPRHECWAAQTPQVFRVDWLREALVKAEAAGVTGTDDAALVERLGLEVRVVEGDPRNLKITTAEDLAVAEAWLASLVGEEA